MILAIFRENEILLISIGVKLLLRSPPTDVLHKCNFQFLVLLLKLFPHGVCGAFPIILLIENVANGSMSGSHDI